jgi:hypothetical protein
MKQHIKHDRPDDIKLEMLSPVGKVHFGEVRLRNRHTVPYKNTNEVEKKCTILLINYKYLETRNIFFSLDVKCLEWMAKLIFFQYSNQSLTTVFSKYIEPASERK